MILVFPFFYSVVIIKQELSPQSQVKPFIGQVGCITLCTYIVETINIPEHLNNSMSMGYIASPKTHKHVYR